MSEPLYYIQDTRQVCGNAALWWRSEGKGYTTNLDEAWKVPGTWSSGRETDSLRLCSAVDVFATRQIDAHHFGRVEFRTRKKQQSAEQPSSQEKR